MDKQKKIEDLLSSIRSLISEAKRESQIILSENQNLIELNKKPIIDEVTLNLDINEEKSPVKDKISLDENKKSTDSFIDSQKTKNKFADTKGSWTNINFKNSVNSEKTIKNFNEGKRLTDDEINNAFENSMKKWVEKNLKKLIDNEIQIFSKKIISEKLK